MEFELHRFCSRRVIWRRKKKETESLTGVVHGSVDLVFLLVLES